MPKSGIDIEVKRFYLSLVFPGLLILTIWMVFVVTSILEINPYHWGILPRTWLGLKGILFSPLIHGDLKHLTANSLPLLVLSTALIYFYRNLAYRVFFLTWIVTGILVWAGARSSYHIGASGVLYGLAGFLAVSGFIRRHIGLIAISFLVIFQYGSMIYGIFPVEERISWESHLLGLGQGFFWAWVFRREGPARQAPVLQEEPEDAETDLPWDEFELEGKQKKPKSPGPPPVTPPDWVSDWTNNSNIT